MLLRRITRAGTVVWTVRVNDFSPSAAVLANGRVLVAGTVNYTFPDQGAGRAMMFDSAGNLVWSKTISGPLGYASIKWATLDAQGNSTLFGLKLVGNISYQPFLEQLSFDGTPTWSRGLPYNPGAGAPTLGGAAIDATGNIYVTARLYASAASADRSVLLKYSAGGDSLGGVEDTLASEIRVAGNRVLISRESGSWGGVAALDLGLLSLWRINEKPCRLLDATASVLIAAAGVNGNRVLELRSANSGALLFGTLPLMSRIQDATFVDGVGVFATGWNYCCGNRAEFCKKISLNHFP